MGVTVMRSYEITVICGNGNACTYWVQSDSIAGAIKVSLKPAQEFENALESRVMSVRIKERGVNDGVPEEQGNVQAYNSESETIG